jgi:O-antigen biosynthesis protein
MKTVPEVSIIIVSFNTKQLLDDCLASVRKSLQRTNTPSEIIVVENASTDGTKEMVKKKYPEVTLIVNRNNEGFGKGNNQGIKVAKGKYILLLNSDTLLQNNAIGNLIAFSKLHPDTFVGPKLYNADGSIQTSAGPFFTLPVVVAALFLRGDKYGISRCSPDETRYIDWVSGACIIAPKQLFSNGLLFDEGIFMYMEEIDLLMRARAKGYRTMFYPEARITHIGAASSGNSRKGPVLNIYRGFLYVYKKHYSKISLSLLRFLLQLKALIAIGIGLVTGNEELRTIYAEAYKLV